MRISFEHKDTAPTLDDNGDLFTSVQVQIVEAIPKNDVFHLINTGQEQYKDTLRG